MVNPSFVEEGFDDENESIGQFKHSSVYLFIHPYSYSLVGS